MLKLDPKEMLKLIFIGHRVIRGAYASHGMDRGSRWDGLVAIFLMEVVQDANLMFWQGRCLRCRCHHFQYIVILITVHVKEGIILCIRKCHFFSVKWGPNIFCNWARHCLGWCFEVDGRHWGLCIGMNPNNATTLSANGITTVRKE